MDTQNKASSAVANFMLGDLPVPSGGSPNQWDLAHALGLYRAGEVTSTGAVNPRLRGLILPFGPSGLILDASGVGAGVFPLTGVTGDVRDA